MRVKKAAQGRASERMSDRSFRGMVLIFRVVDFLFPYVGRRVRRFGIREGMKVIDYGCGPGRYTTRFAELVGPSGAVYAVDIHELAVDAVKRKIDKLGLENVVPVLARGYDSGVPDGVADVVCAIDMFFAIKDPTAFLGEMKRIAKSDGLLIIDSGHERRAVTKQKILDSGHWTIWHDSPDHLTCRPT